MTGTINERTNGKFTVVTEPLWDASKGKKRRRSLGTFDTEEEAERVLARHRADVAEGVFSLPAAEVRATRLRDYLDEWLDLIREQELAGEFKRRTVRDYEATVRNNIQPYIGDKRIGDLTVPLQRRWILDLRGTGLGDRTVQKAHRTLHRALADSGLPENPAKLPKSARPTVRTRKRIVRPTIDEVNEFLDHARRCSAPTGSVLAPLWHLAAATGMRRSELCGLGWDLVDLDADQPTLSIQRTLHRDAGEFLIQNPKSEAGTRVIGLDEVTAVRRVAAGWFANRLDQVPHKYRLCKAGALSWGFSGVSTRFCCLGHFPWSFWVRNCRRLFGSAAATSSHDQGRDWGIRVGR